jgi:MYXO-CTERM domain-containing protein
MKASLCQVAAMLTALLPTTAHAASPIEAVVHSMEVPIGQVTNLLSPDSSTTMFDVRSSLGGISPNNPPTFGVMFTGNVDNIETGTDHDYPGSDHATIEFDIEVPLDATSFAFDFDFLSREFPHSVGSAFSDTFEVFLTSNAYNGQIVFDPFGQSITVNNALFSFTDPADLVGTGFDSNGRTGWVTTIAPCTGGEVMNLRFEIYDVGSGGADSAVLLDNFRFCGDWEMDGVVLEAPWTGHVEQGCWDDGSGDDDDSAGDDDDSAGDDDDSAGDDDDTVGDDDDTVGDDDDTVGDDDDTNQEREGDDPGECDDGADNDFDGDFDCNDSDCSGAPVCTDSEEDMGSCNCSTSADDLSAPGALLLLGGAILTVRRRHRRNDR